MATDVMQQFLCKSENMADNKWLYMKTCD